MTSAFENRSARRDSPLSRAQVREVDRRAIEDFGVPGVVLMENAGRNAARIIHALVDGGAASSALHEASAASSSIAIVCGRGNNAGDGFVIARHLHNIGYRVDLFLAAPFESLAGDAAVNAAVVVRMKLPMIPFDSVEHIDAAAPRLDAAGVIVDAIFGTGFSGIVRPPFDAAIHAVNAAAARLRVAIDVPSGLDCDTGAPSNATVRAHETITFVAPKIGFEAPGAAEFTGRVHVADIGAPIECIRSVMS